MLNVSRVGVLGVLLFAAVAARGQSTVVENRGDLQGLLRAAQENFALCPPPTTDIYLHQGPELLFVDWEGFPRKFKKRAYARMEETLYGLVPKYDLCLWEDATTREIVIENMYGREIARLAPEVGFDSLGWAKANFGIGSAAELTDFQRIIHDSAHTALSLTLTPIEFAVAYSVEPLYESEVVAEVGMMAMSSIPMPPDNTNTTSGGTAGLTNQLVTLTFPLPAGFSGKGELFQTDSILYPAWSLAADRIAITNTAEFEWADPASSNIQRRFYILSDMLDDDDLDGYSNLREALTTTSDPEIFDHIDDDADGLHDWFEQTLFGDLSETAVGDYDNDGLLNIEEMTLTSTAVTFLADPTNPDTDGDGTNDGAEVAQGGNPSDPSDEGGPPPAPAPETVEMILSFESTDPIEAAFTVAVSGAGGGFTNAYDAGEGGTTTLDLIKGKSYVVTISDIPVGEPGGRGFIASVSGQDLIVVDPSEILNGAPAFLWSEAKTAAVHAVELTLEMNHRTNQWIKCTDKEHLAMIGETIEYRASVAPAAISNLYSVGWSGEATGQGSRTSVLFDQESVGRETYKHVIASFGEVARTGEVAVAANIKWAYSHSGRSYVPNDVAVRKIAGGSGTPLFTWFGFLEDDFSFSYKYAGESRWAFEDSRNESNTPDGLHAYYVWIPPLKHNLSYGITNSLGSASYAEESALLHCQTYLDDRSDKLEEIASYEAESSARGLAVVDVAMDLPNRYPNYPTTVNELIALIDDRGDLYDDKELLGAAKGVLDMQGKYVDKPKEYYDIWKKGISVSKIAKNIWGALVTEGVFFTLNMALDEEISSLNAQIEARANLVVPVMNDQEAMRLNSELAAYFKAEAEAHAEVLAELHEEITNKEGAGDE